MANKLIGTLVVLSDKPNGMATLRQNFQFNGQYVINPSQPEDFQHLWQTIDCNPASNLRIVYLCDQVEKDANL